jgi:hypothetical protein
MMQIAEHDSQAADEEEGGGLRTITFADGKASDGRSCYVSTCQSNLPQGKSFIV